jgi:lipopolysaccharide exporter
MTMWAQTAGNLVWAYGSMAGERALSLLTTALLARILYPSDFGVLALALVALGYIDALRDFGIKDALIYSADRREKMADTAATLGLVIGLVQCAVAMVAAPLASHLMDDDRITLLIQVLSLTFVINALAVAQDGLLQRRLSFRSRFAADLGAAAVKAAITVALALAGAGVWAIAAGHLAGAGARTLARTAAVRWIPRFHVDLAGAGDLWRYGRHILFVNIVGAVLARADQLLIAALIGSAALGYYYIAARIPELIIGSFNMVLTLVLFPVMTKLSEDKAALASVFCGATRFTVLLVAPISAGLIALAPELVHALFGPRWAGSAATLQVLAAAAMVASLGWNAGDLFKAIGRPGLQSALVSIEAATSIPLIIVFAWWSQRPEMVALGYLAGVVASTGGRLLLVSRLLSLTPLQLAQLYSAALVGAAAVLVIVSAVRPLLAGTSAWASLPLLLFAGAAVYLPIVWSMEKDSIKAVVLMVRTSRQKTPARDLSMDRTVEQR